MMGLSRISQIHESVEPMVTDKTQLDDHDMKQALLNKTRATTKCVQSGRRMLFKIAELGCWL
jgi:hypothetical protein